MNTKNFIKCANGRIYCVSGQIFRENVFCIYTAVILRGTFGNGRENCDEIVILFAAFGFGFREKLPKADDEEKDGEGFSQEGAFKHSGGKGAEENGGYSEQNGNKGAAPFYVAVFYMDGKGDGGGGQKEDKVYSLGGELFIAGKGGEVEKQDRAAAYSH